MCGRYSLTRPDQVIEFLGPVLDERGVPPSIELSPRYNIAPTQELPILANRSRRAIEPARWGLIPRWADSPSLGARLINARAESLAEKPAFRDAFARRRCLVPADGFYEWRKTGGRTRQPTFFHLAPRRPLAFAGLWDAWRARGAGAGAGQGGWLISFTIITCPANPLVAPIHHRMPVVLAPDDWPRWLTADALPPDALADLLQPADPAGWAADPVGPFVNAPDHEGPACLDPPPPDPGPVQGSLF